MSTVTATDPVAYHEQTKHRFERYARGPETIDWNAQPDPFRRFAGAPTQALPFPADDCTLPFSALYAGPPLAAQPLSLRGIAQLLETSLALSAWKQYGSARWSLRCNPSSGNLHPTEAYVIATGIDTLGDGVYHYRADEHLLERRCEFTQAGGDNNPALFLGFSSVHWREAWKYGERAYRYCQLDLGHALAAVGYAAALLGWKVTPHLNLGDQRLAALLGIDRDGEYDGNEREHPDLLLSVQTTGETGTDIDALLQRAGNGKWSGQANVLDARHFYDWPLIDAVAAACVRPDGNAQPTPGFDDLPPALPSPCAEPATQLIRRRRSAQTFDGVSALTQSDFFRLLDHLLPRAQLTPWTSLPWTARVHPLLFIHRVEGIAPGLYALPRRSEAETTLRQALRPEFLWQRLEQAPPHLPLYRLLGARAERTATRLSCLQDIAGDSAFSLSMLAEFEEQLDTAPWRYRELHWEAGALGQVLYLEAEALGLRGTGIGCFFDDGVHELLGLADKRLQVVYHFTVGGAVHDPRLVSLPPYPNRDAR